MKSGFQCTYTYDIELTWLNMGLGRKISPGVQGVGPPSANGIDPLNCSEYATCEVPTVSVVSMKMSLL